jgi:hypothetical protein
MYEERESGGREGRVWISTRSCRRWCWTVERERSASECACFPHHLGSEAFPVPLLLFLSVFRSLPPSVNLTPPSLPTCPPMGSTRPLPTSSALITVSARRSARAHSVSSSRVGHLLPASRLYLCSLLTQLSTQE